ncbi:DUF664 domain-containing protein [Streptomyces sp. NPDC087437]|uniref:mycothiol transferase n=1 Tax=Streptomyces sp. NPDC087437 TaxID=3365789 RepID=UPI00381F8948
MAPEQAATDVVLDEHTVPGRRVARDGDSVRELWVHRIEEHVRRCGHADLLRECIDGRVGRWRASYMTSAGAAARSARRSSPAVSAAQVAPRQSRSGAP